MPVTVAPDNWLVKIPVVPVTLVNAPDAPVTVIPLIVPVAEMPEPKNPEPLTVKSPVTVVLPKEMLVKLPVTAVIVVTFAVVPVIVSPES